MDVMSREDPPGMPVVREARAVRFLPALLIAATLLVAEGLGLRWIERTNTDLPPAVSIGREFAAAADAVERVAWDVDQPEAGAQAWTAGWVALNGQYDARLLATAALGAQLLALGLVLVVLARLLPPGGFLVCAGLVAAMVAARSAAGPRPLGDAVWAPLLVTVSVAQVALLTGRAPGGWRVALGLVLGVLNILAAPEGVASSLAVGAWHALGVARDRTSWPACRTVLIGSGLLTVGGVGLVIAIGSADVPPRAYFEALGAAFAWPCRSAAWALVLWAPAVFCLVRVLGGDTRRAALAPLALLALALTALAAVRCGQVGVAGHAVAFLGLAVNAACCVLWWTTSRRSAESRLVLAAIWGVTVFAGLSHGGASREPVSSGPTVRDPATLALRRAAIAGRADAAADWSDPRIRAVLPPSMRVPLGLGGPAESPWSGRVPEVVGQDELPAVGTWSGGDGSIIGEYSSGWMETAFPLLEVRMCGTLRPPETEILLRAADGTESRPWTSTASSPDRWKRLNFSAPDGPFQLVVRDASPASWIAVAAPVEIGWAGWVVRQLAGLAPWLIVGGFCCGLAALGGAVVVAKRMHAAWVARGAPMFPWHFLVRLAFLAGAIYFALNLDTTAGPNDSGGYLNSAKLLARGHIAADAPAIPTTSGPRHDAQLVLPITFRVAPDGRMAPEYPVGLPLMVATVAQVLPMERAVAVVVWLHLVFGVLATSMLARIAGLSRPWSWLAAAIIGLSPLYIFQAVQPMTDVAALGWVTLAVVLAWKSRERLAWAVPAGLVMAMAVLLRPSNVLAAVPVLVCLAGRWRQLAVWGLAGVPVAVWLLWYQKTLYGDPLATGYGSMPAMFGLRFFWPTVRAYAADLPLFFSPAILLVFAGPFLRGISGHFRVVLTTWVAAFVAFYSVYWCTWDNGMRFLLPAAPAMVVLMLAVVQRLGTRLGLEVFSSRSFWRGLVPSFLLPVLVLGWLVGVGVSRKVLFWPQANREHAVVAKWTRDHLPGDAVVFAKHASGSLRFYTDLLVVRIDRAAVREPGFIESIAGTGRPVYAVTYHWETPGFDPAGGRLGSGYPDLPGRWEQHATLWDEHAMVWAWHPGERSERRDAKVN